MDQFRHSIHSIPLPLPILHQLDEIISTNWHDNKEARDSLDNLAGFINNAFINDGKLQLFFSLHHGNFPSIEYLARMYRQEDYVTIAVYFFNSPPATIFDKTGSCVGSFRVLYEFLQKLPAISMYVQAHAKWSFLGLFIKSANPRIRVYQEVYDWMTFFINPSLPREKIAEFISPTLMMTTLAIENSIVNYLDGFLYKDGGPHMEQLIGSSTSSSLKYFPCPPSSWQKKPTLVAKNDFWRLVYTGQMKSKDASTSFFGDLQLHELIADLNSQDIIYTAYTGFCPTEDFFHEAYGDYLNLTKNNRHFVLKKYIPIRELIDVIANKFHFGLLIYYFEANLLVGKKHLESALPSKLFTYIAAGLPVIISEELVYAASIVSEHEIGIVVSKEQIKKLSSLLTWERYLSLLPNIEKAQKYFNAENFFSDINTFIQK